MLSCSHALALCPILFCYSFSDFFFFAFADYLQIAAVKMIVLAMLVAGWFVFRWMIQKDLRIVLDILAVGGLAYIFMPSWSFIVVPVVFYTPPNVWLAYIFTRRPIQMLVCFYGLCAWIQYLCGMTPPLYGGIESFVLDMVNSPYGALVVPFKESILGGLLAIRFFECYEEDKKFITTILTDLFHRLLDSRFGSLAVFRGIGTSGAFVARCDDKFFHQVEVAVDGGRKLASSPIFLLVVGSIAFYCVAVPRILR